MNFPKQGIIYIKSDDNIPIKLERTNEIIGFKQKGEFIVYDKIEINNITKDINLSFIDEEDGIKKYCHLNERDISIAPIRSGNYSIKNNYKYIIENIDNNPEKTLCYFSFFPEEGNYSIQLLNTNRYLSIIDGDNMFIDFVEQEVNEIQKWNLQVINPELNIYQIKNTLAELFIDFDANTNNYIASEKNEFPTQQFYIFEEFEEFKLNAVFPIINISKELVENKNNLKYVYISNSVKTIKNDNIFENCFYLEKIKCNIKWLIYFINNRIKSIEINEGEKIINKIDFIGFENINEIKLPFSLEKIEEDTFSDFNQIKVIDAELKWHKYFKIKIEIPINETKLRRDVFSNSKFIKEINIPNGMKEIEEGAFENSGIENIELPEGVQVIPKNTFKNCKNLIKIKLPRSIISISPSAFVNCQQLTEENVITLNENFNGLIKRKIEIDSNIKNIQLKEYSRFIGVDDLNISVQSNFNSEKEAKSFFNYFNYITKGSFSSEFLKYSKFENLLHFTIPTGIQNIPNNSFDNCPNLEYLEIPETIYPQSIPYNIFFNLTKLKQVQIPSFFYNYVDELFKKCINLMKIIYSNGITKEFKTIYEVPPIVKNLNLDTLINIKNLGTLIIPKSVESIEKSVQELSKYLECIECDPKWLKYFPIIRLKKIIIPKFIDEIYIIEQDRINMNPIPEGIDETLFNGGNNIEEIVFKCEKMKLLGKRCRSFENIKVFRCFPLNIKNVSKEFKISEKIVYINEGTKFIEEKNFKDWKGLKKVYFPNSLQIIEKEAFCNCINLSEVVIPQSVYHLHETSFKNCINIRKIKSKAEFLNVFPPNNVVTIIIDDNTKEISEQNIKKFTNLIDLTIPEKIKKLPFNILSNFPKFQKIKCCTELLKSLSEDDKRKIKEIELYKENKQISKEILKKFINVQDIGVRNNDKIDSKDFSVHSTDIDDIVKSDYDNIFYKEYLEDILKSIKEGKKTYFNDNDILGKISNLISEVCINIKNYTKGQLSPHPVQCFAMLRLIHEITIGKGALAQIATGEGKSYIIAVVAIVLVKMGRIVDIVTSNLELAFRDEKEQNIFYKEIFNIDSGVLCDIKGDKQFINLYKSEYLKEKHDPTGFYTHVLKYPIVYSTNYNFQFLHLHSFGLKVPIRKRKYDIVIIDEVDNMLLDQMSTPSIVGWNFNISKFRPILNDFFEKRNFNEEIILDKLKKKYKNTANINEDIVRQMKISTRTAERYERNVDYVKENNNIFVIDESTGFIKENLRWFNYVHELVEIKEGVNVKKPIFAHSLINQNIYFNFYKNIIGVSGTLGDLNDQEILEKNYKVKIFRVPRDKPRIKPIYIKERPNNIDELFNLIYQEIQYETGKGRPVLVIMDNPKRVDSFVSRYGQNEYGTIRGINIKQDKESIKIAGNLCRVTISTQAGGRGTDIKLNKDSIDAGGLHVIIPFQMVNKRVEDQAIGRSGRQGQPGSVSIYRGVNDKYLETPDFDPKNQEIYDLQEDFSEIIKSEYSWVFNSGGKYIYGVFYKFNSSIEDCLKYSTNILFRTSIIHYIFGNENAFINSVYTSILDAWCTFYESIKGYQILKNNQEEYKKFLQILHSWFPTYKEECFQKLIDKLNLREKYNEIIKIKQMIEKIEKEEKNEISVENPIKNTAGGIQISTEMKFKILDITKALFGLEINLSSDLISQEIIIWAGNPLIKLKFNWDITKTINLPQKVEQYDFVDGELKTEIKSSFHPLSLEFNDLFGINAIKMKADLESRFGHIINTGSIKISFGIRKISIVFSFSTKDEKINYSTSFCCTFTIQYFPNKPVKVPVRVPAYQRVPVPAINALPNFLPEYHCAKNLPPKKELDPFNNDIPEYGCEPIFLEGATIEEEKRQSFIRMGIYGGLALSPILVPLVMGDIGISITSLLAGNGILDKFRDIGPFVRDLLSKRIPQLG